MTTASARPALAIIEDVIAGRYVVPETGRPIVSGIESVVVAPSLEGREGELVRGLGLGAKIAVVADENTAEILGRRVAGEVAGADLVLLEHPKADEANADRLQDLTRHADALVAVGSGTINDLCKYVTHRTGRSCAVFATAPSMDGYVTSTASITREGFKLSLKAHTPKGVFFDLDVLRAAPKHMILAGLGDTVCRTTAQVDWLLQHMLLDTVYTEAPYDLMREDEPLLYAVADRLTSGDRDAMLLLTRLSILSGLGVLITNTSHCGSMSEHAISHYIDMLADPHPGTLHGEQVGIATWTTARLQAETLADETPPVLKPLSIDDATLERRYGRFAQGCRAALAAKPYGERETEALNRRLAENWPAIRTRLLSVMLPVETLLDVIERSGMPRTAAEIRLDPEFYRQAVGHAHEIRDRYGFIDLAAQSGRLDSFAAGET